MTMLRDSSSYEVQIIDAVRSVNTALGGRSSVSSAIYKSEFNQYEVQLIDAIRSIGKTLKGGVSLSGSASGSGPANIDLSGYVPVTRTINGHALSSDITLSATTDLGVSSWVMSGSTDTVPLYVGGARVVRSTTRASLITVGAISHVLTSGASDKSRIEWDSDNGAWHFQGNLYADGWVAAGGLGTGGSGGGGLITSVKVENDLGTPIVTESINETFSSKAIESIYEMLLTKQDALVSGTSIKTINGMSILGSGDLEIGGSGGGSTVSVNQLLSTGTAIATITVNNVTTTLYAPTSGGLATETDPVFVSSPAYGITASDIASWNGKGTVSSVALAVPAGLSVSGSPVTTSGTITISLATGYTIPTVATFTDITDRLTAIESWFEVVTVNSQSALHAKGGKAIYSDSWVSAGGVGSGSGGGGSVTVDSALSSTSENPVQNKAIYAVIGDVESLLAAI